MAPALLDLVRRLGPIGRVVCDRAYSSKGWRQTIATAGAEPVVPSQKTHLHVDHDRPAYGRRHRVETLWARLKERRSIATRYDKSAASFMAALHLAASLDWLAHKA